MSRSLLLCLALGTALPSQATTQQPAKPAEPNYLQLFEKFDAATRRSLIRALERKVQLDTNPAVQRIVSMQRDTTNLLLVRPRRFHRAEIYAPGAAPSREVIEPTDKRYAKVRKQFPRRPVLPGLNRAVFYEWASGKLVRRATPLSDIEQMENLLRGYPPGSDIAYALLLQQFDNDPKMRPMSKYLGMLYADLDGHVFRGITLYEAWYSGESVFVPDVDAIPFERQILGTKTFRSPIPADHRRAALYKKIRDHAFAYRKYRTLREAAAAAFLRARPEMDPTYQAIVPRFHYLYATVGDDPVAIRKFLADIPDRNRLIQAIDEQISNSRKNYDVRLARRKDLENMQAWVSYWAKVAIWNKHKANERK